MVHNLPFTNTLHADAVKIKQDYAVLAQGLEGIALPEPVDNGANQQFHTNFRQYSTDAALLLRTTLQQLDTIVALLGSNTFDSIYPANGEEEAYRSLLQSTIESLHREYPVAKRLASIATDMSRHVSEINAAEHSVEGKEAMYHQYAEILDEHRPELENAIKISTQRLAMLELSHGLYQESHSLYREQCNPPADQPKPDKPVNVAQLYADFDGLLGKVEKLKNTHRATSDLLQQAQQREESLRGEYETILAEKADLQERYETLEERTTRLDSTLRERESELQDARQSIDELTANLTHHQQQLATAKKHITVTENEYEQQRATNNTLMVNNAALNDDNSNYRNRIQDLSTLVETYQRQLVQNEEQRSKLEADVARERTINLSLLTQTKGSIAYKDQEIHSRNEIIRSQEEELRDLKEKMVRLKEDLSEKLGEI